MQIHKSQRVGVFVDVQNIVISARALYNAKVNFRNLLNHAVGGRTLIRAFVYTIRTPETSRESFFESLARMGFEIKAKDVQIFPDGSKKGDWDIGMAMDAIELAPKLDTIVIVSGDGDFIPLIQHLQRAMGCRVEVVAFGRSTNKAVLDVVDDFTDLDANKGAFLMRDYPSYPPRESSGQQDIEVKHDDSYSRVFPQKTEGAVMSGQKVEASPQLSLPQPNFKFKPVVRELGKHIAEHHAKPKSEAKTPAKKTAEKPKAKKAVKKK